MHRVKFGKIRFSDSAVDDVSMCTAGIDHFTELMFPRGRHF